MVLYNADDKTFKTKLWDNLHVRYEVTYISVANY